MADCIQKVIAASGNTLSKKDAEKILTQLKREAGARMRANRQVTKAALHAALNDKLAELPYASTVDVELAKLRALSEVRSHRTRQARYETYKYDIVNGLKSLIEGVTTTKLGGKDSLDARARALTGTFRGKLHGRIAEAGLTRDFNSNTHALDIRLEMESMDVHRQEPGKATGNIKAAHIAKIIKETNLELNTMLRAEGVPIHDVPGYVAIQTHDPTMVRKGGRGGKGKLEMADAKKLWKDRVRERIDESKYEGRSVEDFLDGFVDSLYSGVYGHALDDNAKLERGGGQPSLVSKLTAERLLHFKDAKSAHEYSEWYGTSDLATTVEDQLRSKTNAIAQIQFWGHDPDAALSRDISEWKKWARNQNDPKLIEQIDALNKKEHVLRDDMSVATLASAVAGSVTYAQNVNIVKSVVRWATLGGAIAAQLADTASSHMEIRWQGVKALEAFGMQLESIFKALKPAARREAAAELGVAIDSIGGHITARFDHEAGSIPNAVRQVDRLYFKANLTTWWTSVMQTASAMTSSWTAAKNADIPFTKLDERFKNLLNQYSISNHDWDIIRTGKRKLGEDREHIFADTIKPPTDAMLEARGLKPTEANRQRVHAEVKQKFQTLITDRTTHAIVEQTSKQASDLTLGTRPGTHAGTFMRLLTMFKGIPTAIFQKRVAAEIQGRGYEAGARMKWLMESGGPTALIQMAVMMTALGYVGGMLKDIAKGKERKKWLKDDGSINTKTALDALMKGGAAGVLGDVLFQEYDRSYRNFWSVAGGPVLGQADALAVAAQKLAKGEPAGRDFAELAKRNMPFANLIYIRGVVEHLYWQQIAETLSPGSLRRLEREAAKAGQEYWWEPDKLTPWSK